MIPTNIYEYKQENERLMRENHYLNRAFTISLVLMGLAIGSCNREQHLRQNYQKQLEQMGMIK
jgi:hypothetical protein